TGVGSQATLRSNTERVVANGTLKCPINGEKNERNSATTHERHRRFAAREDRTQERLPDRCGGEKALRRDRLPARLPVLPLGAATHGHAGMAAGTPRDFRGGEPGFRG